jgi:ankyrin repeat protein
MKNAVHLLCICVLAGSACMAGEVDYDALESSQRTFEISQSTDNVIYMPIQLLFPDKRAREMAVAAEEGNLAAIDDLVAKGADINYRGPKGATVLFWALRTENIDGFRKLLELGADPNLVFDGGSVMHWAASAGDTRFLAEALKHGGNPNLKAGNLDETPIFDTIGVKGSDNLAALKLLVESGADVNARTGVGTDPNISMGGKTPAMAAAELARFDIVYQLLVLGADFRLKDDYGNDLMDRALSKRGRFPSGSEQEKELELVLEFISRN